MSGRVLDELRHLAGVDGCWTADADSLPARPGAYLLLIDLGAPLPLDIRTLGPAILPAGRYLYAGSAYGPGGIRARAGRHLRRGKARRWHVDHVTEAAAAVLALPVAGGNECVLVNALLSRCRVAVPGFGNTDCRACPGHLLAVPGRGGG